jgi:hypothetical protein
MCRFRGTRTHIYSRSAIDFPGSEKVRRVRGEKAPRTFWPKRSTSSSRSINDHPLSQQSRDWPSSTLLLIREGHQARRTLQ